MDQIRKAEAKDLTRLTEIYNQAILSRRCTGDMETFRPEERKGWLANGENERTPIYVYEEDGEIAGYVYISAYRPGRQALCRVGEISYYVDFKCHGKGVGSKLVSFIIERARELDYKNLIAVLMDCNEKSTALIEKFGFQKWGLMPDVSEMDGQVFSHLYYGRRI